MPPPAARLAFLKYTKPIDTMEAPMVRDKRGFAVQMFQTIPMPEVRTVPASVSRLAIVTVVVSEDASFTIMVNCCHAFRLVAGAGIEPASPG